MTGLEKLVRVSLVKPQRNQKKDNLSFPNCSESPQELATIMSSEVIRKCVWNFKEHRQLWMDHLGIEVQGLIDLYPICRYFFPELMEEEASEDCSGVPPICNKE